MRARVMTFHVDADDMAAVVHALDASTARFEREDSYKGLLCLKDEGLRNQLMIVTLWDDAGLAATAQEAEEAKALIASATDTGVASRDYSVLRFLPRSHVDATLSEEPERDGDPSSAPASWTPPRLASGGSGQP